MSVWHLSPRRLGSPALAHPRPATPRRRPRPSAHAVLEQIVIASGALVLLGWTLDLRLLKGGYPSITPMKANAALAFLLAGAALALVAVPRAPGRRLLAGRLLAASVVLIGALTLAEYGLGWHLGIDQLLFHDASAGVGVAPSGRMGPNAALAFVLLGLAILLLDVPGPRGLWPAEALAVVVALIAMLRLTGYVVGVEADEGVVGRWLNPMALNAATTFVVAAAAVLAARPRRGLAALIAGPGVGGAMIRRLGPPFVVGTIVLAWLGTEGVRKNLFHEEVGVSLIAAVGMAAGTAVVVGVGISLEREARAVAESEQRLRLAQTIGRFGSWEWLPGEGRLLWSPELEAIYGLAPGTFEGTPSAWHRLVHPDDIEATEAAIDRAAAQGRDWRVDHRIYRADGALRWVSLTGAPTLDESGNVVRLTGIVADITDRKEVEHRLECMNEELEQRVRERTAELEAFSYSVSHDLRAPLRAVGGFAKTLREEYGKELPERARLYLGFVSRGVDDMTVLIDGLLRFSRLASRELALERIALGPLVREVVAALRPEFAGREVELEIGHLPVVLGDRVLVRQVLVNLISNALKFTRDRQPALIEVGSAQHSGETVVFVRDNGVGFDMQYADRLFGVFQRLHRADEFEGAGVGLALVARIVARHKGRIWADAVPGGGATFSFTLGGMGAEDPFPGTGAPGV